MGHYVLPQCGTLCISMGQYYLDVAQFSAANYTLPLRHACTNYLPLIILYL